jgi:DNA repair exonuclease SbcCD ATPase subunit
MSGNYTPDSKLINRLESLRKKISKEQQTSVNKAMSAGEETYQQKVDELLDYLTSVAQDISRRRYGDPQEIFELTKAGVYPDRISELAESFGMMIVKVEARELRLEQTIGKLKNLNERLQDEVDERIKIEKELKQYRNDLEKLIQERTDELLKANELLKTEIMERQKIDEERKKLVEDLQEALDNIKTLKGLIPICASCKKIRDDKGYWNELELYISENSDLIFRHSLCPDCLQKHYPEDLEKEQSGNATNSD